MSDASDHVMSVTEYQVRTMRKAQDEIDRLRNLTDQLKTEAQTNAMEARVANASLFNHLRGLINVDSVLEYYRARVAEAVEAEREACARIAREGCLVPPDGGSPTEEERIMCEGVATAIRNRTAEGER